ncbi:MAG: DUF4474 domain-containing protein [Clostridia bacterium]|nr:DUF4474 domain-containing protein [Clostridia bacterium]
MKSTLLRIFAAMMALVMMVCCFTACSDNTDDPEITKPSDVKGPDVTDDLVDFDGVEWDDPSTTGTTTTTTTTKGDSSNNKKPTTTNTPPTTGTTITKEDLQAALTAAGYAYDQEQQVYYSTLEPWQRHFGFGDIYDDAAAYANMRYTTLKADFEYDGLLWRLQWWKGQYGILEGAELGVYTKDPNSTSDFYDCADNDHLIDMSFEYYRTGSDFKKDNMLFYRHEEPHWWLTGFKVGYVANNNSSASVVVAKLKAYDEAMANGIESGLRRLTDKNGTKVTGFVEYGPNTPAKCYDYYIREGNNFTVVWQTKGYKNHQTSTIAPDA